MSGLFLEDPVIWAVSVGMLGASLIIGLVVAGLGQWLLRHLVLLPVLLSVGCSTMTLRPVNPNHAARKAEVTSKLGTDENALNQLLAQEQAQCDALDNKVTAWTAASVVLGALSGGSGITAIVTPEDTSKYVVGAVGVGLTTMAALSAYMSTTLAQKYARKCTVNTGGR